MIAETDRQCHVVYKRAFNTQACGQLSAWIGGSEFILKKMTPGNFNWFLHTMLFYHTQYVINKQIKLMKEMKKMQKVMMKSNVLVFVFSKRIISCMQYSL